VIWKVTFDLHKVFEPTIFGVFEVFGVFWLFLAKNPKNTYFACFCIFMRSRLDPVPPKIMKSGHKITLLLKNS
jgi:hypothetical protein